MKIMKTLEKHQFRLDAKLIKLNKIIRKNLNRSYIKNTNYLNVSHEVLRKTSSIRSSQLNNSNIEESKENNSISVDSSSIEWRLGDFFEQRLNWWSI